ncbi:membrane protein [Fulvitalea axinellae]|uniref:Membrane protein n=1 Tax=Fulvitalea axinellae TaxID=1182444 RepID=A0AAU9CJY9_9BACT|nr:membrane protein [Fulvitalea axinellae]
MFKILDRYIIRKFLTTFFFVVLIIVSVVCVIDFAENNQKYIENAAPGAQVFRYYLDFGIWVANFITPLTIFIATVYVTAMLTGRSEIVAILSGGVSFNRLLQPYIVGSVLVGVLSFGLNGWVIPNTNKNRLLFEQEFRQGGDYSFDQKNVHVKVADNLYLYLYSYNVGSDSGRTVTLEEMDGAKVVSKLTARRMQWRGDSIGWRFKDWERRDIDDKGHVSVSSGKQLDTLLNISPKYFGNQNRLYEALTMPELDEYIADLRTRGADNVLPYVVEKYIRFTSPFAVIILTLIGVVVSSKKSRGGAGAQIAIGFTLAFVYIIFFMFSRTMAEAGSMNPIVAVWIPNVVFAAIGAYLYKIAPK